MRITIASILLILILTAHTDAQGLTENLHGIWKEDDTARLAIQGMLEDPEDAEFDPLDIEFGRERRLAQTESNSYMVFRPSGSLFVVHSSRRGEILAEDIGSWSALSERPADSKSLGIEMRLRHIESDSGDPVPLIFTLMFVFNDDTLLLIDRTPNGTVDPDYAYGEVCVFRRVQKASELGRLNMAIAKAIQARINEEGDDR